MKDVIILATPEHARLMAPHMRAAEVAEILADNGMTPEAALLHELDRSLISWAWIVNGEVACMFGIVAPTLLDNNSYPWFLTTPLVEHHWMTFARRCRALLPELLAHHPRLIGMVDARYTLSIRWLKWLGALVGKPQPWGVAQMPFCRFELEE